ncbi:hydrogenase maturation protein HypF [Rhodoferax lacus]|uniref:Hydrogenase maturation protein HypF n=1 Tax=Rhodoferax lacus TaxID=2184758 RepID=A0A3E1R6B7_9BURK|nr:carbamoyltransferase HypF [Rhodoferax lacus]RFO94905.1 hydrogenase maturation protein HypF [Rhodoferax lacus]
MSAPLPSVLACGAWLKNAACLLEPQALHWSALHGDLSDPEACRALDASARALLQTAQTPVAAIAHDLHPDFYSTQLAQTLAEEYGIAAIGVQHHHAHIAAIMAEHGVQEAVVGLALDGVGLGSDGLAWGGELLWVSPYGWERLGHLHNLALPGGDVAAREPWRMAASALHALGRGAEIAPRFSADVGSFTARTVQQILERQFNCPLSSSTGRWFDAAAASLGLSLRQSHEAEAAMALEAMASEWQAHTPAATQQTGAPESLHGLHIKALDELDLRPLLARLLDTPASDAPAAALWFHQSLADALVDWAALAAQQKKVETVCLGGGCFANQLLSARVCSGLRARGLRVLQAHTHSCGDAGLALGQAWVAAHQLSQPSPHPRAHPLHESPLCV